MARTEPTLVTVLRHGEVAGRPHVFRGASDEPLSERGRQQARRILDGVGALTRIASSPLRRCREIAEEAAAARGLVTEILPDLAEMRFGAWEGASVAEVADAWPEVYAVFRGHSDRAAAPGGESLGAFRRRVVGAWEDWLADAKGGHRLLVSHAGVMRVLLGHILAMPAEGLYRFALPEAAHFRVSLLPGHAPILLSLNACADSSWPFSS